MGCVEVSAAMRELLECLREWPAVDIETLSWPGVGTDEGVGLGDGVG